METTETLGKYEIKRTLGRGAMGVVYEGWDPVIARRVAIKTVKLAEAEDSETVEQLARFRREAQAAGRLIHPNIVGVFDYGEANGVAYIVMEYVDGPPLKSLLDKHERFTLPDIVRIMEHVLTGLQFSHERGVVHRDIKPANVMLTNEGQAKIADFGIARIESSSMTQAGTLLGTPAYMSPEQFMGQVVDARSDLYSAGVLLYQLLTGERPYEGGFSTIMHKVLNTEPPAPSEITVTCPPAMDPVVRKAMAKRPEQRFRSATEFMQALRAAALEERPAEPAEEADEATVVAAPAPKPMPAVAPAVVASGAVPAQKTRFSLPLVVAAVIVVLLVAGGGGWFFLARSPASTTVAQNQPAVAPLAIPAPPSATTPAATPTKQAKATAPPASAPATSAPTQAAAPPGAAAPPVAAQTTPPASTPSASSPPRQATGTGQPSATPPSGSEQPTPAQTATTPPASTAQAATAQPTAPAQATTPRPAAPVKTATMQTSTPPSMAQKAASVAQPPASPGKTGAEQQVAAVSLAPVRRQVQQIIASQACATLQGTVQNGGAITMSGLAGTYAAESVRQRLTSLAGPSGLEWQVTSVDPYYCPALDVVHSIAGVGGTRVGLALAGGKTRLRDGDHIMPQIVMPDFRAYLRVDYVTHDGEVVHLYPQVADPANNISADPRHAFAPGAAVKLGLAKPGHPVWEVGAPYGKDMIIAIASGQPLFNQPRPAEIEKAGDYLPALQAAVNAARQRGMRLDGSAIVLDTLPK